MAKEPAKNHTSIMLADPRRAILAMILPFVISSAVAQINMLVDTAWCSVLGSDHVAAIQTVNPIYWVIFDIGLGIGLGSTVLISRSIGENDLKYAERIIPNAIIIVVVSGAALAPLMFLLIAPMLDWMGAPELTGLGESYLLPILILSPIQALSPTFSGFLKGEGASTKSNISLIAGSLFNIALDPILIFGFDMGLTGAGLATALSAALSVVLMLRLYVFHRTTLHLNFHGFRPDLKIMGAVLRQGIPKTVEMLFMDLLDAINRTSLILCGGTDAVVLFSTPYRVLIMFAVCPNAISFSMIPVMSANIGAGNKEQVRSIYHYCLKKMLQTTVILMGVLLLIAPVAMKLFTTSDSMAELEDTLVQVMRILAFSLPFFGSVLLLTSTLQAFKKPLLSMGVTFTRTSITTIFLFVLSGTGSVPTMSIGVIAAMAASFVLGLYLVNRQMKLYLNSDCRTMTG